MRPVYLLLMILASMWSPVFAQKQIPSSLESYAFNWGYSVKKIFRAAGYDVPGPQPEYDLKPRLINRSNELRLDSTVSYFGYDLMQHDSLPLFRNEYTYPQDGVEVITESFFNVDYWLPLSRTTLISDELGRLVDAFAMVYDETTGEYLPDSRIEYFPHGNSQTDADSFFVSGWSVELRDWVRLFSVWNTYDAQGRLTESLSSTDLFEFPIIFLDRYHYSAEGDLLQIESFNVDAGELYPAEREEFFYDDHLLITSTKLVSDGFNGFLAESKIEYRYTPFRKEELVQHFVVDAETNDWKLIHVDGYAYDAQYRVIMKEIVDQNEIGGWERVMETYGYVQDEYLAYNFKSSYDVVDDEWKLEEKKWYYYTGLTAVDPVDPIEVQPLTMWPNPASDMVRLNIDEEATVSIYGGAGQLSLQQSVSNEFDAVNVSSLPAGSYYISAKTNDQYYSGKLVIQRL